ncbi:MAG TPA: Ig-like domain-containing protein [Burkholderiaceae bacterium]|nr:Ig-like domain-containing protein [Burkholderiaceae bacterium]
MTSSVFKSALRVSQLAASLLLLASGAVMAQSSVTLTASPTTTTLPDGQTVPMWGYTCGTVSGTGVSCTAMNGSAQSATTWQPPLITVPAGQTLTINLTNSLSFAGGQIPTSLVIDGQLGGGLGDDPSRVASPTHAPMGTTWPGTPGPNDGSGPLFTPPAQADRVRSFGTEVAAGASAALCWGTDCPTGLKIALRPGTYIIHSGTQPSIQHPMGLYGVLVVTDPLSTSTAPQAYGQPFDKDVALLFSEIDPEQNRAVDTAVRTVGFDPTKVWSGQTGDCGDPAVHTCYPPAVNYSPLYYLINGVSFDRTNVAGSTLAILAPVAPATTVAAAQGRVLLRLANAGLHMHVPAVVGLDMTLLAEDGNKLPGLPRAQSSVFLSAGKTYDVTVPPKQTAGNYNAATYAVFDRSLAISTNNQRDGGMQAYISIAGGAASGIGTQAGSGATLSASGKSYACFSGVPLNVSDPQRGLLGGATGANGVVLGTTSFPTGASVQLAPNGTFSYTPPATGDCSGSFTFVVNKTTTLTATIKQCTAAACGLGGAPTGNPDSYTSSVASRLQINRPGVLANDSDPSGLPLKASAPTNVIGGTVTLNPDGSFIVTPSAPPTGGSTATVSFQYQAVNSQNTASAATTATVTFKGGSGLQVTVRDGKTPSQTISDYRWIIEEDRTIYIDPSIETTSSTTPVKNAAINFHASHMPVVAQGCTGPISCESGQTTDQGATPVVCDVGNGACRPGTSKTPVSPSQVYLDPAKRYYISVLPSDSVNPLIKDPPLDVGHAMSGAQIAAGQTSVDVFAMATPIKPAQIAVFIFQDDNPLNGEADTGGGIDVLAPNEAGLGGFNIVLLDQAGGLGDSVGQITYDMSGQPVTNALAGKIDPVTGNDACPITKATDGLVGVIVTCPKYESDGKTLSPLAGHAIIANMYPGLYEVAASPGGDRIARGEEWLQTNTLDGTKPIEAFIMPGEPSYFQEFGPGGYHVAMGFANPAIINARKPSVCAGAAGGCNASFYGRVSTTRMSRTPDQRVYGSGSYDSNSYTQCYVSLGYPDSADFAFAKCDPDGKFEFTGIPTGNFKITVFDQYNDLLVDGLSTPISAAASGPGSSDTNRLEIPVMQWRTNLYGRVFIDTNGDGVSQDTEPGLPLVPYNIRMRDGSYFGFNNTDLNGYAGFNEVFPILNWLVVDIDNARYKLSGVHVVYDAGGPADGTTGGGNSTIGAFMVNTKEAFPVPGALRVPGARYCAGADCPSGDTGGGSTGRVDPGWASTQGWQGLLGNNGFIEFAMKPFASGENGGIKGHVIYTSTRPFDDPQLLLQLSWEPGVANVKVNLYQKTADANGNDVLKLVDTTSTTSWDDWAQGFRRNADNTFVTVNASADSGRVPNMSCPGQDGGSPFYFTMRNGKFPLDPDQSQLAYSGRYRCYDGWSMLSQIQPAPYNGMYKFPSIVAKSGTTKTLPTDDNWTVQLDPTTFKTNCTICTTNPVDGTPMLPPGKYVVEVIVPPGYELVKEEDKNILLGDAVTAALPPQFPEGFGAIFIMPDQAAVNSAYNPNNRIQATSSNGARPRHEGDTGSVETFWPCVGDMRIVPDLNSLYPGAGQQAPFAGARRPLCDRKEIALTDQMTALAKFYLFSSAHVASHFTGTITNDFASEFDPYSPQFGEKFAVPNVPVAVRDPTGKEISRVYADQWGIFNGLTYSSWTVFPPSPSGYTPTMMIMCMNDPGPIPDPAHPGQTMTDPNYNPAYSNFCYEWSFMPGQTSYLDTPVVPTMAFAAGYNLPDCEYPDTTPAIKMVVNSDASAPQGPWVRLNTPATASITLDNVSNVPADFITSVTVNTIPTATTLTGGTITCNAASSCNANSQTGRNNRMAVLLANSINSRTGVTGYSAVQAANTVTITGPTSLGASLNGRTVTVVQSGITVTPSPIAFAGGATGNPNLTISALGDKRVLNHAYSGPNATSSPFNNKLITRHYGFGSRPSTCPATGACPNVTVGGVALANVAWSDTTITGTVQSGVPACAVQQRGQPAAQCGELVITAANGQKSIDTVMVTVGGKVPTVVTPSSTSVSTFGHIQPNPLQTAIDQATPGDLIIVAPGTYRENLLMWKPVRLQGVGAESVTINADAHPAGKLDAWRRQANCLFGLSLDGRPLLGDGTFNASAFDTTGTYSCPANMQQRVDRIPFESIVGWDTTGNGNLAQMLQEPTLMGAYEGAGVTVLARGVRIPATSTDFWGASAAGGFPAGYEYLTNSTADCTASTTQTNGRDYGTSNFLCNPSRIDGVTVINSSQGGGAIFAHGWNHNLEVSNTRIRANHGTLTGGISIGNGEFPDPFIIGDALNPPPPSHPEANNPITGLQVGYGFNRNTRVHHNMVTGNASLGDALYSGTPSAAGGITFCSGSDGYVMDHNWVCGNLSSGDAGGVAHSGFINNGTIKNNWILFNQSQSPTIPTHGGGLAVLAAAPDRTITTGPNAGLECGGVNDTDCPPGLAEGTGRGLMIDGNLILGNSAESGSGGGLRLQIVNGQDVAAFPLLPAVWNDVTVQNNIIANNVAGWDGGGVSMQDALKVTFVNNTVISNDTTGSAGVLFNSLGAPIAAVPPPGCTPVSDPSSQPQDPSCINPVKTSTNQPAGLVTMAHTPNLVAALPAAGTGLLAGVNCPVVNTLLGNTYDKVDDGNCRAVSLPVLVNNIFWKNRPFHVEVTAPAAPPLEQQSVATLVPSLNQTATGFCATVGTANGAPHSGDPVTYWDIGVRGDTSATSLTSGYTLKPQYSILSSGPYVGSNGNLGADPAVIAMYCNGARLPPEGGGNAGGYMAPPGRSETTGLYPVFALNQVQVAATVDEGNNWINLIYGPLSLNNAALYTAPNVLMMMLGDYRLQSNSPAINKVPLLGAAAAYAAAPDHDFFGNPRKTLATGAVDIGAVEQR